MKKFILTGLAIVFLALGAQATTIVNYRAGMPSSMTTIRPGYMRTTPIINGNTVNSYNNGMRAVGGMHPMGGMRAMGGMRPLPPMSARTNRYMANRYYNNYNNYNNTVVNTAPKRAVSRFSKNYTRPQRSSYTRNGVTYYN